MILTCPSCGTQYVVKDGAIPPSGRQVRCKACQHSWREMPPAEGQVSEPEALMPEFAEPDIQPIEASAESYSVAEEYSDVAAEEVMPEEAALEESYREEETLAEAPASPPIPPETEIPELAEAAPSGRLEWVERDEDFSPFATRDDVGAKPKRRLLIIILAILGIAAIVAAVWFLAPPELRQRLGIAGSGDTPLQLMMTHSDRTQLASGNEFLNISGRIINPTDEQQKIPPITAQLHDASGKVVYKWTIPPPMKMLPPGGSASFNSAELNIPPAAQELTVTLGDPKVGG
ncbi:hypothetical protein GCM10023264_16550 [Sphingomonas daechungensis]|uniref:zinc-ribbon domain-containing protein n=1 Tax=Sphingomonas daechungensis TaxID=1176646 RepID=UPI0031E56BF7